jgi:hypothetical protein
MAVVARSRRWPGGTGDGAVPPRAVGEQHAGGPLETVVRWQRGRRHAFVELSADLYRAIGIVAGAAVVVDSSKLPQPAGLLLRAPAVTPYFVHIVRDPRGVLFSRQRRRLRARGGRLSLPLLGLDAYRWLRDNVRAEGIGRSAGEGRSLRLHYEELVADPASVLQRILAMLGEDPRPMPFLNGTTAQLGVNHTVRGNPNRFTSGEIEIREDREWTQALGRLDRLLAGALTAPLLLRYGYPLRAA